MTKAAGNPAGRVVHLSLGATTKAELDWRRRMLRVHCASDEVAVCMLLEPGMVGDYTGRSGSLAIATCMVMELRCSPEEAMELVDAIGPRAMSDFVFIDQ